MLSPQRRPTVADVARLAGTSTAVVSYVINDGPRPVAPHTRQRVLDAIEKVGFRPSRSARALRSQRAAFLGLVVPGTADPYYVELAHSVEAAASRRGYLTMTGNSGFSASQESALTAALIDEGVAGMIIAGVGGSSELQHVLASTSKRTVFMHHRPRGMTGPLVTVDNHGWAIRAVTHLIEHGYQSIAVLTHQDDEGPVGERFEGWKEALTRAGGSPSTDLIVRTPIDRAAASEGIAAWLTSPGRARALFAATDELAFGVLHRAGKLGIRIPEDLAVISFDGVAATGISVPELSTVQEPFEQIGERAVQILLDEDTDDRVEVLDCRLIYRRSCGCS